MLHSAQITKSVWAKRCHALLGVWCSIVSFVVWGRSEAVFSFTFHSSSCFPTATDVRLKHVPLWTIFRQFIFSFVVAKLSLQHFYTEFSPIDCVSSLPAEKVRQQWVGSAWSQPSNPWRQGRHFLCGLLLKQSSSESFLSDLSAWFFHRWRQCERRELSNE